MPIIKAEGYNIIIKRKNFKSLSDFLDKRRYSAQFILCDKNTLRKCLPLLIKTCPELKGARVITIQSGEAHKSLESCTIIWRFLMERHTDRDALLINLGGGMVSDLGGYAASVYKRGIDFINVPTTLLAMADASVGGKTGINFLDVKNAIGSFAQPKMVLVNTGFLATLPKIHVMNGFAEIFKIGLVSDKNLWKKLTPDPKKHLEKVLQQSIGLKNKIVRRDPLDKGVRKILNFGHSIGHAIEILSSTQERPLLHGYAVTAGMIMEAHIAFQKKMLSEPVFLEIVFALESNFGLQDISMIATRSILEQIKNDKKNSKIKMLFSLPTKIGTCSYNVEVSEMQIKKAINYYNHMYAGTYRT